MKKINFYNYLTNFSYSNFLKKQLIYAVNPIKHFNDVILNDEGTSDSNIKEIEIVPTFLIKYLEEANMNTKYHPNILYPQESAINTHNLCIISSGLMLKKMRAI